MYELLGLGSVDRGGDGDDRVIGRTVNINTRVFTSFFLVGPGDWKWTYFHVV